MMRALILCCLAVLGAAGALAGEPDWRAWAVEARKRHELAGQVYDVHRGKLSDLAHETAKLRPDRTIQLEGGNFLYLPEGIVLLGEVHDNPDHHQLRAWLIAQKARLRPQWRPAVVFEQIRTDQQPALDRFKTLGRECCRLSTAVDLLRLLEWDKSGWPPAELFQPLFDAVLAGGLPILPGDPPRDRVRAVARGGAEALAVDERTRLGLDIPLPPALAEALDRELKDSHCGALPPQAIGGMALAQRYRDAHLAAALLDAAERHGSAVLIAGNGHVRADRGVPWHIRRKAPQASVLTVLHIEVKEGENEPAAYVPRDPDGKPAADLVIFTPRARRDDPCQAFVKNRK
jgi:uncharacterized iron-regulated protein